MTVRVWRGRRWLVGAVAMVVVLGTVGVLAPAGAVTKPAADKGGSDRTSAREARRVDSVPTPKLDWRDCALPASAPVPVGARCTSVLLPLDYDEPNGATTKVALLRLPARDQAHRVGTLFVNPGGPGESGTDFVRVFGPTRLRGLLDRFDVVGFDPRGTDRSDQVKCFTSTAQQTKALKALKFLGGLEVEFPMGRVEERAFLTSARKLGVGCSSTGRPLSASMSTAEVARDMDVLRRAVGDSKLTFLGFSYGSYLGQVYANMFPDRVRAMAIDAVLDPVAWAGTPATAARPQEDRVRSADGASKALLEILRRCDRAGIQKCKFAPGDPVANYDLLANRLKKTPLTLSGYPDKFTYAALLARTSVELYFPRAYERLDQMLSRLMILTEPADARSRAAEAERSKVMSAFADDLKKQDGALEGAALSLETYNSVSCTDGVSPPDASRRQLVAAAAAADKRVKHFGRLGVWKSAACAGKTWTVRDEDAYRGPFNRRTASPVLVVGSKWDPSTNYEGALKAASLLPNSRLLSSDSWGHGSYHTSQCASSAINSYLLTQVVPARGTVCHGDVQPFQDNPANPTAPPN